VSDAERKRPDIPGSALERLPIFPLPNVVLFPGALLPLHVFEERYRELAADVLEGNRLLAVPLLRPGYQADYQGSPAIHTIAGIGYVIASQELEDGRYNLVLRGLGRVGIESEHPPRRLYREVVARALVDSRTSRPAELAVLSDRLMAVCAKLADRLGGEATQLRLLPQVSGSPGAAADLIAAALVAEPAERQSMLELLDPADRLELLLDHLSALLGQLHTGRMPN
jgi:Lon protease-like protein